MKFALGIITHTPLWAWALLAYLVWQGIKGMQPRTTTIWRALIVPAIFIVWGLSRIGFGQQANGAPLIACARFRQWRASVISDACDVPPKPDEPSGSTRGRNSYFGVVNRKALDDVPKGRSGLALCRDDCRALSWSGPNPEGSACVNRVVAGDH